MSPATPISPTTSRAWTGASAVALALLLLGAGANLWFLIDNCPLDLSGDEAHYWEWSRRPDLSYYSKGPLVAHLIAASRAILSDWSQRTVGSDALAVRVPAVALSVLTGLGIFTLARLALRRPWPAVGAVALTFLIPILAAGSCLMTIDAPLACAWVWTLVCLHRAIERPAVAYWVAAGLLIALGILAKYTMVLIFPVVALALLGDRETRGRLRTAGPYIAVAIGLTGLAPIAIWNARHDWVSFRHVAGQAGVSRLPTLQLANIPEYVAGQIAVTGVVWAPAIWWAVARLWRRPRTSDEAINGWSLRLLLWATVVPWAVFLLFSPITKIQPNWPVVSLLSGVILFAEFLSCELRQPDRRRRRRVLALLGAGAALGGSGVLVMHRSELLTPLFARLARNAPAWELTPIAKYDPTARLRGWSQLGAALGDVLREQRQAGRDPMILAEDYQLASELAFYTPGRPLVYCLGSVLGGRMSQYDLWPNPISNPEDFVGRPCIYVGALHPRLKTGRPDGGEPLRGLRKLRTVTYSIRGQPVQVWSIFACDSFAGFDPAALHSGRRY